MVQLRGTEGVHASDRAEGGLEGAAYAWTFFRVRSVARKKTGLLIVYFVLAVILIIVTVYLAIAAVLHVAEPAAREGAELTLPSLWDPQLFAAVAVGTTASDLRGKSVQDRVALAVAGTRLPS